MQKRHEGSEPQNGTHLETMPRAPARLAVAAPTPRAEAPPREAPSGHPVFAHHERVAAAHAEFLKTQERVHLEFIAHRKRLLEWLGEAGVGLPSDGEPPPPAQEHVPAPILEAKAAAPVATAPTTRETHSVTVRWDDALLDSHVLPIGALFSALGGVVSGGPNGGDGSWRVLACELRSLGGLAGPGDTVATTVRSKPAGRPQRSHLPPRGPRARRGPTPPRDPGPRLAVRPGCGAGLARAPPRASPSGPMRRGPGRRSAKFSERDLAALHSGEALVCFGAGFERAAPHTRTPPLPGSPLVRLTTVSAFDPTGGAWSLGSLRAQAFPGVGDTAATDDPGLRLGRVYQGAQQALAFFVMAAGGSIARDGWRFENVEESASSLRLLRGARARRAARVRARRPAPRRRPVVHRRRRRAGLGRRPARLLRRAYGAAPRAGLPAHEQSRAAGRRPSPTRSAAGRLPTSTVSASTTPR